MYFMIWIQIKYPIINNVKPVTPLLRTGYCRNDKINSRKTKIKILVCITWFSQLQKETEFISLYQECCEHKFMFGRSDWNEVKIPWEEGFHCFW